MYVEASKTIEICSVSHCTLSAVTEEVEGITIDGTDMDVPTVSCSSDDVVTQLKVQVQQMRIEMEKKGTKVNEQDALVVKLKIKLAHQVLSIDEPKPSVMHPSETRT